jgi:parvulin-like peptidyl-prolyl isomerase
MGTPTLQVLAVLLALLAGGGCARQAPGPSADKRVLEIEGQPVYLDEFQQYLKDTLGSGEAQGEGESEGEGAVETDPPTLSRLFDQFVEEQMLLQQARNQGMQVSDTELQAYLEAQGLTETTPEASDKAQPPATEHFQARVRSSLMVQKFKDQVILKEVRVKPEEIEKFFREHPSEFQGSSRVVLRQILIDEEPLALSIKSELDRGASFQELAARHSLAPDRGEARQYEEGDLPEEMQAVIASLKEGQVSGVVNVGGRFHILRLEARQEKKSLQALDEVRERIEFLLLRRKTDEAMARYLADLRDKVALHIYYENLPFQYQAEAHS